jgi:hypothetical protein
MARPRRLHNKPPEVVIKMRKDLYESVRLVADREERTLAGQVNKLMESALRQIGMWPPPAQGGEEEKPVAKAGKKMRRWEGE